MLANRDASAVSSPPAIIKRLIFCEPGSKTPSLHLALLSSNTTYAVAYSVEAGASVRSRFDILILRGWMGGGKPILPPGHPPPHRIYSTTKQRSSSHHVRAAICHRCKLWCRTARP